MAECFIGGAGGRMEIISGSAGPMIAAVDTGVKGKEGLLLTAYGGSYGYYSTAKITSDLSITVLGTSGGQYFVIMANGNIGLKDTSSSQIPFGWSIAIPK